MTCVFDAPGKRILSRHGDSYNMNINHKIVPPNADDMRTPKYERADSPLCSAQLSIASRDWTFKLNPGL